MISVKVNYRQDKINQIVISGHSGYDESGKDIVCSAVSTAMFVSLGLIEKVCPRYNFKSDEKKAVMTLKIIESNEITDMVLENLIDSLYSISCDYGDYLAINYVR
ncbi:MAG: ribosomal-processing cysteine protease Prp [Bacilli bacterium]|nr:ribosomal-processing cysteine protease Prp [Bacilli bacterium]MDD4077688.1 ribosomal-processing cysteine protease Prp [Bacilli bacterium]MDD4388319.1 ribosomal-processing cysteine protease Prp [Bacilli bacterium]